MRILTIFGTRPEAIKLAPVIRRLSTIDSITHASCVTGQHREMLDPILDLFGITPDFDLKLMQPMQDLTHVTTAALAGIGAVIDQFRPDWVIVQGDTTSAFAGALAAFYRKVRVAHVEAGLRTGDIHQPWPEEMNRKLVSQLATLHFPPTAAAEAALLGEGVAASAMLNTGNSVIDALHWVGARLDGEDALRTACEARFSFLDPAKRLILVTGHRRENLDGRLAEVCAALRLVAARGDVEIVYPVHLNPAVRNVVESQLVDMPGIHLLEPQDYLHFLYLMRRATLIVTDSGGIQEEAPALGKPVLVTRGTTERPEAVAAGTARLVGPHRDQLIAAIAELLDEPLSYAAMTQATQSFGDGRAAERIVGRLLAHES